MDNRTLKEILSKHYDWLNGKEGGVRADLRGADLRSAYLRGANLRSADLRNTYFSGADLRGADLRGAYLNGADLFGATCTDTVLNLQCPEEGSFIAWKKLRNGAIAKLLIPSHAKRSSATSRKCRASEAKVLAIYNFDGAELTEGYSNHYAAFVYKVGETVYPDKWDEDRWDECSNGIHFFITREEAEEYQVTKHKATVEWVEDNIYPFYT